MTPDNLAIMRYIAALEARIIQLEEDAKRMPAYANPGRYDRDKTTDEDDNTEVKKAIEDMLKGKNESLRDASQDFFEGLRSLRKVEY